MPKINIVFIGKLKEQYFREAQDEYLKRLSAFCRVSVIEKKEASISKSPPPSEIIKAVDEESTTLLNSVSGSLIALSLDGVNMDSEGFSHLVMELLSRGDVSFVVGGSYGLSPVLKKKADAVVSFSKMTMPHQLFRIVLLEQIYRAFMISGGRTYHK